MIRRKKHLDYSLIRYYYFNKTKIKYALKKSFLKNYKIQFIIRMSLNLQKNYRNLHLRFYRSQNKLQCPISYSFSVPSSRLRYSRFFLNKSADRLFFGGFQKK